MLELQLQREGSKLTERFLLYRLVVFCLEQTKSSIANETLKNSSQRRVQRIGG